MNRLAAGTLAVLAALLAAAPPATAATVTTEPSPAGARTFADGAPGWTTGTERQGPCLLGVTCPAVDHDVIASGGTEGAGDGYVRTRVGRLINVLSSAAGVWRSPTFTPAAPVDRATLGFALRSDVDGLVSVIGDAELEAVLVDTADASNNVTVLSRQLADTSGFVPVTATLPAGAVVPGRTYRLDLRTRVGAAAAVPLDVVTDLDDVTIELVDLLPPSGLTATVPGTGAARVAGAVNPEGQATSVLLEYGPTAAYGSTAGPVVVSGTGAQSFELPFAGLTPGATYHFRVTATNLDGTATTADATFVAPTPPPDAPPVVSGALNQRLRTVTYTPGADVTAAELEIRDGDGSLVATVTDDELDGTVAVTLPDIDGAYAVRVVRHGSTTTTSADTATLLDRAAPDVSGVGLVVAPVISNAPSRTVTFDPPADSVSAVAQVRDAGGDPVGAPVALPAGGGTVTLAGGDGTYTVDVTFADAAGNEATVTSAALTLDRSAPDAGPAPTVTGAGGSRTRHVSFTRAPDAATVVIEIRDAGGELIGTVPVPAGGEADITLPDADGTYAIVVRQRDAAGNESVTAATAVALDRTPAIPAPADPADPAVPAPAPQAPAPASQAPAPGSTLAQPRNSDPGGYAAVLRSCYRTTIAVTRVFHGARRVRVSGIAAHSPGTRVIVRTTRGKRVGAATIRADGTFRASLRKPKARVARRTKYRVHAGGARSNIVFHRAVNALLRARFAGGTAILRGRLDLGRLGRGARLIARGGWGASACSGGGRRLKVSRARINRRTGAYTLRVRVPAGTGRFVVRTRALGRTTAFSVLAVSRAAGQDAGPSRAG